MGFYLHIKNIIHTFTKIKKRFIMVVRYENTKYDTVIVISEIEKFLGECTVDQFVDAMEERDSFEEDDYQWFFVSSDKISIAFNSFSRENMKQ